jgi:uncharacterized protein YjiS (DUF1127 family)
MTFLKMISKKYNAWRRHRDTAREHRDMVRELSQFSDHDLLDMGIRRCDLEEIVHGGPGRAGA